MNYESLLLLKFVFLPNNLSISNDWLNINLKKLSKIIKFETPLKTGLSFTEPSTNSVNQNSDTMRIIPKKLVNDCFFQLLLCHVI